MILPSFVFMLILSSKKDNTHKKIEELKNQKKCHKNMKALTITKNYNGLYGQNTISQILENMTGVCVA